DIANRTCLSLSTVHRIVRSLVSVNILEQNSFTGKYKLGSLLAELGIRSSSIRSLELQAYPEMHRLATETGEGVNLGVLVGCRVIYIQRIFGAHPLRTDFPIGTDVPAHCSAIGKSILALSDESVVSLCLQTDFEARTPYTITNREELEDELSKIRENHYALDREEMHSGITCVGAPICRGDKVLAAVAIQAPTTRMDDKTIQDITPSVIATAKAISETLL
ncbi:MAG: IclR family transcriptional regulator, partial [Firmicutes bacterium]|nr:IclR family transcriptional regulator [Bacillota bacterium]